MLTGWGLLYCFEGHRPAVGLVSPHDFRASSSYTLMSNSILNADVFSSAPVAFLKDPHTLCISVIILRGNKIPQNEPYIWITGDRSCFSFSSGGTDSEDVQMQTICGLKKRVFCGSAEILLSNITWQGVPLEWIWAQRRFSRRCEAEWALQINTMVPIFSTTAWPRAVKRLLFVCLFNHLFGSTKTNSPTTKLGDETVAKAT